MCQTPEFCPGIAFYFPKKKRRKKKQKEERRKEKREMMYKRVRIKMNS